MKVTEVKIKKNEDKGSKLKAAAEVVIDNEFVIHRLGIVEGKEGLFVTMPSIKNSKNEFKDICHPITRECRKKIEESVLAEYNK